MSERKAIALMMTGTILSGVGAWLTVVLLSGNGGLATAALIVVGGIGIDQMSRVGMRYDRR
jgi:hypothetical protein